MFTNSFCTRRAGLAAERWSRLAVTLLEGSLRLYVDGSLINSSAVPGAMADPSGPLRIDGEAIWAEFFGGLVDELRVHNRALTAAEIQPTSTPRRLLRPTPRQWRAAAISPPAH